MFQVNNLSKTYGRQVIFEDISFVAGPGERVGLVGRNGHGKTTLFRMLSGEERPDSGVISVPSSYTIGHLSQYVRFTEDTVLKEACLSLKPSEDGRDETYKVETVLSGLGFSSEDFHRSPLELSGGFQIRLNLAKALILEPNLLLLDEPANYLDILSIRWLRQFLRSWKTELMLITHDRAFMDSVTTHTMGIHRCKVRKIVGPTEKLYQQILMEEEVYEKRRINDEKKRSEADRFISRFRAQATRARAVQSRIKALQKKEKLEQLSGTKTLDFEFNPAPFPGKWLMEAKDISFSFEPQGPLLIDGLTLSIGKNDRIAIVGKNGKGKTTLLNLLAGELSPLSGAVTHHQRLELAYFGQTNIDRLDAEKTVEQEILDVHPDRSRGVARSICGIMMFEGDSALKRIGVLSGGERSRVLLGKLLVSPANLLLLDEPTNHLDMESIDSMLEAIEAFPGAVVIVTHSEMILNAVATRLVVFDDGKVSVFEGTYQDFLERIGWKSEESKGRPLKKAGLEANNASKKDLRRIRAEFITNRAKVLGALQKRITEVETAITRLEREVGQDTKALLDASEKGEWQSIARLSTSINDSKRQMDVLFNNLERLTSEYAMKLREFEEKDESGRKVDTSQSVSG